MTALVVLPTFNEAEDVLAMVEALVASPCSPHVCVVDDASPDGTSGIVADAIAANPEWSGSVQLITRSGKGGRGGAVRAGLMQGLRAGGYDAFVEMDCDFSHDPDDLTTGLELLASGWDVAIGSRYPDGRVVGWPLRRRLFSRFANAIARLLIDSSVHDYTNGFRFYTRNAAEVIIAEPQRHTGYIYLSETIAVCLAAGLRVTSFPIVFSNRQRGESSTDAAEIVSAARGIVEVGRWYRSTGRR